MKVDEYGIDLAPGQLTSISIQLVIFKYIEPIIEAVKHQFMLLMSKEIFFQRTHKKLNVYHPPRHVHTKLQKLEPKHFG